jgi:predicted nucleic acid-binding protein
VADPPGVTGVAYLDSSALVKLAVVEPESRALRDTLKRWRGNLATGVIAHVEVPRAVLATGTSRNRARLVLARIATIHVSDSVIAVARSLEPPTLRSLDAIHIASAISLVPISTRSSPMTRECRKQQKRSVSRFLLQSSLGFRPHDLVKVCVGS